MPKKTDHQDIDPEAGVVTPDADCPALEDPPPSPGKEKADKTAKTGKAKPADADLTHVLSGLWPGNPPHRAGSWYIDLKRLALEAGQTGLIGTVAANFVFERVDVHCLSPANTPLKLEILTDADTVEGQKESMALFLVSEGNVVRDPDYSNKHLTGCYLGGNPVYCRVLDPVPTTGRIVITMVGYLIEPWR